jgi:hypothetical protein
MCDEATKFTEVTVPQEERRNEDERRPFGASVKPAFGRLSSIEARGDHKPYRSRNRLVIVPRLDR